MLRHSSFEVEPFLTCSGSEALGKFFGGLVEHVVLGQGECPVLNLEKDGEDQADGKLFVGGEES